MRRAIHLAVLIAAAASVAVAASQGPPAAGAPPQQAPQGPRVIEVEKLRDNLFVLKGGGGNSVLFVTTTGAVVVDTKLPGWGQPLLEKIRTLTDKPVTMIINTHTHRDHTSGNPDFPLTADIIAHENTKTNMAKMDLFREGDNARFLPKRTYRERMSLLSGQDRIELYHFGVGGTNGDTWIVFPPHRTLVGGDAFAAKEIIPIDTNNGGSAIAYTQMLSNVVAGIKDVDTVITGHGPVMTWNDMKEYADFYGDLLTWTQAQRQAGKTVDQAAAEYRVPDRYRGYQALPNRVKGYIQVVYDELGK